MISIKYPLSILIYMHIRISSCLPLYIYVYVCMCICVYVYMCICVYVYVYMYMNMYVSTCIHIYMYIYIYERDSCNVYRHDALSRPGHPGYFHRLWCCVEPLAGVTASKTRLGKCPITLGGTWWLIRRLVSEI